MKHIKLINEYNTNDEWYKKIELSEFKPYKLEGDGDCYILFNNQEVTALKKQITSNLSYYLTTFGNLTRVSIERRKYLNSRNIDKGVIQCINIHKYKDEWYYVDIVFYSGNTSFADLRDYYKCDGFEGLLKLLQDKLCNI